MICAAEITKRMLALGNKTSAELSKRFFKTGPGEYGEGDQFLGIRVPVLRAIANEYRALPLNKAVELLQSPWHEIRQLALLIMVLHYRRGNQQEAVFRAYLDNTRRINNWDLVDCSAEHIPGAHLFERDRSLLLKLAQSRSLWERRIAIVTTFYFIRRNQFDDTLAVAAALLYDPEDLIHKAVGWMLREVGKRSLETEERFLREHGAHMPRTMLRYAIERFPEPKRSAYLLGSP